MQNTKPKSNKIQPDVKNQAESFFRTAPCLIRRGVLSDGSIRFNFTANRQYLPIGLKGGGAMNTATIRTPTIQRPDAKSLRSFNSAVAVRRYRSRNERLSRHRIFDRMLSLLEGKQIKLSGQFLSSVLHPLTVKGLLQTGWTQTDVDEAEASIFADAEYLRDWEVWRSVPRGVFSELKKQNLEHLVFEQKIVGIPNGLLNALICSELSKRFSTVELKLCGCFVRIRDFDLDGGICEAWRIDLDENLSRRGFIVPVIDREKLIEGLRVFRYLNDSRPFMLRTRKEVTDKTNGKIY
jgi:hypothetical protein